MKRLILLLLLSPIACTSIPFKKVKPNENVQDETKEDPTISSVRGAASKLTTLNDPNTDTQPSLPTLIESFFQTPSEISSLKETLHIHSNTAEMKTFLQTTRRALHRKPELMYELPTTSNTIQSILDELDIKYTTGWAKNTHPDVYPGTGGYGIVAHIGTMSPNQPCLILRADMDALPILESTPHIETFKSTQDGKMHACGHDGHVTMLLGAAALLKKMESEIEGTVRLVFQPAEEGGAGMKRMVEEGVVTLSPEAKLGFGMHVWPGLPTGTIAAKPGTQMAAAEMFEMTIIGKGGHAAMPHLTIDPIVTASSLILNLQSIISRTISPLDSGVISVTAMNAGDAFNVIPAHAVIKGTIRALTEEMLLSLRQKVDDMAHNTATVHQCNVTISYSPDYYLPSINDPTLFPWSKSVGELVSHEGIVRDVEATMGGEDFAFLANEIPSTFFLLGQGSGGEHNIEKYAVPRTDYGLHHPSFALDEEVLPIGVELHVNLALRGLKKLLMGEDGDDESIAEEL